MLFSRSLPCRASIRSGIASRKRRFCRRSKNWVSASFPSARSERASSQARSTKTQRSTALTSATLVPRFNPENRKANHALVDLLRNIARRKNATPGSDRACMAAGTEAVDCAHSRHHQTASPGREHRSRGSRAYRQRSGGYRSAPPGRDRRCKELVTRSKSSRIEQPIRKGENYARSSSLRTARRAVRRPRDTEDHRADRRDHPASPRRACAGRTSGRTAACSRSTARRRWGTSTAASSRRSAAR